MKKLTISEENAYAAYAVADEQGKKLLSALLGTEFKPQDTYHITDRIKTYEDACSVLGVEPQTYEDMSYDVAAYLKLCTIIEALNEGWLPQFTKDEYRYHHWFKLFTQKEIDNMDTEKKARVLARSYYGTNMLGGVAYAGTYNDSSLTYTLVGSRLALKSKYLAKYCGEQFIDIWADYIL